MRCGESAAAVTTPESRTSLMRRPISSSWIGARTAVGFTSARRLTAALGARQPYIRLAESCLRALSEPLGVGLVTVDPQFAAASVGAGTSTLGDISTRAPARATVRPCLRHYGDAPLAVSA
ncbi:SAV_915 family protein [Streptomyces niveus]